MDIKTFLGIAHIIGVAFGLGGATVSDVFFLRILKNKKINNAEYQNLKVLSRIVWAGIAILIISGLGFLWLTYSKTGAWPALQSPRFLAKLTLVAIVFLNGLLFHFYVFRRIKNMVDKTNQLKKHQWLFAVTGAVSATSWYTVVIIASLRGVTLPYWGWMGAYLAVLVGGILTARLVIGRLLK